MIKLVHICLTLLVLVCCADPIKEFPNYWEYSPGKWVAFKTGIEIEWRYDGEEIDKFRIETRKIKLHLKDILTIKSLIHRKNVKGLIEKENSLRNRIRFNEKVERFQSSTDMNYKDIDGHEPVFGEIRFYQVMAMKNFATSLPAELSVIILDRSK